VGRSVSKGKWWQEEGKVEGGRGTEIKRCKLYKEREKIERGRGRYRRKGKGCKINEGSR
jgi:hypothetical protein